METSMTMPSKNRFSGVDEASIEKFECSRQCTAVIVADCIALGCCPCAVVNMLTLTLVKVPWVASRKCLAILKRRSASLRRRSVRDIKGNNIGNEKQVVMMRKKLGVGDHDMVITRERDNSNNNKVWFEMERNSYNTGGTCLCGPNYEAERMWMELYQIGQWGFGRLSFSDCAIDVATEDGANHEFGYGGSSGDGSEMVLGTISKDSMVNFMEIRNNICQDVNIAM